MKFVVLVILFAIQVGLAEESLVLDSVHIPADAVQVAEDRVSIPLSHKANRANLIFRKMSGKDDFCIIDSDQARNLVGSQFKEVDGLKVILVKWSFVEPVDEDSLASVHSREPTVYTKDSVLYVSSGGIDIGNVAKVVEGVIVLQVAALPEKVVHKFARTGW